MTIFDIFWIFLIFSALQPIFKQQLLESARRKVMAKLENKRKSRVIALVHCQETLSFLGFPIMKYIDIQDSEAVLRAIRLTAPDVPIDMILHTPGGLVLAAEQIAHALLKHPAKVTVFIPHYAMSGGTLIALAADEIVMDENAVLGPLDPQLGQYPAASILKVVEQKPIAEIDDHTLILADMSRKAITQIRKLVLDILKDKLEKEKAEKIADIFTSGIWTHDYPITVNEAKEIGLPITTEMPEEVYQLMELYPQTVQRRPSVEYTPLPYFPKSEEKRTSKSK